MYTPMIVKAGMLVAAVALLPAHGAMAHQPESGMMRGQGPNSDMPGAGMMGQGYGMGPGMGYGMGYGMGPGVGYGMMNMMPMMHGMMMGPGMMGHGYGMGPGMMGHGYGMGPGMMGHGYGMGPGMMGDPDGREVAEDDVRSFLARQLEMRGLERLKVGGIDASDERVFKADIVTKEESLVVRVVVDRGSGFPVAFE
jgi:hypothetical protein